MSFLVQTATATGMEAAQFDPISVNGEAVTTVTTTGTNCTPGLVAVAAGQFWGKTIKPHLKSYFFQNDKIK